MRAAVLLIAGALALSGCGLRPLYRGGVAGPREPLLWARMWYVDHPDEMPADPRLLYVAAVDTLLNALEGAVRAVEAHCDDYHHVTLAEDVKRWKEAIAGCRRVKNEYKPVPGNVFPHE